jgi:monoamine oxidase
VRFTPALDAKRAALGGLGFGPVIKLSLKFRSAFWEELDEGRYRDGGFFHAPSCAFPTFWSALPLRAPTINAWAGGPRAARLSREQDFPGLVRAALAALTEIFGERCDPSSQLEAARLHDWQCDPFAHGAYSYVAVGGATARRDLAAPLEETLFFAGEATDEEEPATVTGALLSGERAAAEVLAASTDT